jgi:hypothetical protein
VYGLYALAKGTREKLGGAQLGEWVGFPPLREKAVDFRDFLVAQKFVARRIWNWKAREIFGVAELSG